MRAYRLYPGELDRPAFVAAAARIAEIARTLTSSGAVVVDLRAGRFHDGSAPLPDEGQHGVLARILYAQGVERLVVTRPPSARELGILYEEMTETGGAPLAERVARRGIEAIVLGEIAPIAAVVEGDRTGDREEEDDGLLAALVLADDDGSARDRAEAAAERLRALLADVSTAAATIRLVALLRRALVAMPVEVRRALHDVAIEGDDDVARVMRSAMTDAELADALAALGSTRGADPLRLAEDLVARGERHRALVALTRGAVEGRRAGADTLLGDPGDGTGATYAELLVARGIAQAETVGASAREAWRIPPDEGERIARSALRDYLVLDEDEHRRRAALTSWAAQVRTALRADDLAAVERLAEVSALAVETPDVTLRGLLDEAAEAALDLETIVAMLPDDPAADLTDLGDLLRPFGGAAIDRLFAVLAEERDRTRRARLIEVLAPLSGSCPERLDRWLDDSRWFVVRNAVHVLAETGDPGAATRLRRLLPHPEQRVRREAVRGLVALEGATAVGRLRELALHGSAAVGEDAVHGIEMIATAEAAHALADVVVAARVDERVSEAALVALGRHPHPAAEEALARLASQGGLGRRLRRLARQVAAIRGTGR